MAALKFFDDSRLTYFERPATFRLQGDEEGLLTLVFHGQGGETDEGLPEEPLPAEPFRRVEPQTETGAAQFGLLDPVENESLHDWNRSADFVDEA